MSRIGQNQVGFPPGTGQPSPFPLLAMAKTKSDIGLIGLAVMGQNLALNIADHGEAEESDVRVCLGHGG